MPVQEGNRNQRLGETSIIAAFATQKTPKQNRADDKDDVHPTHREISKLTHLPMSALGRHVFGGRAATLTAPCGRAASRRTPPSRKCNAWGRCPTCGCRWKSCDDRPEHSTRPAALR